MADQLQRLTPETDMVFREDGAVQQLGQVSGSLNAGYVVALTVPVSA